MSRIAVATSLLLATLCAQAPDTFAQSWPARPVRLILPYPPGGASDILVRMLAEKLAQRLGQAFPVENRPGGSALVGIQVAAQAPSDGYTLTVGANDLTWIQHVVKTNFDLRRDLAPVTIMRRGTLVAWVNAGVPAQTVAEFIAHVKASPGRLNYGSNGNGSGNHLAVESLKLAAGGFEMLHVPYKGESQSVIALATNEIQLVFGTHLSYAAQAAAGKVRALAVAGERRLPALSQTPTFVESGLAYTNLYWSGFFAPAGTAREITGRVASELKAIYQLPDVNPTMIRNGEEVGGQTPEEFGRIIAEETDSRLRAVRAAGVKPD